MSVYLGYDTITKQYLRDLVSERQKQEWVDIYTDVGTTYTYPLIISGFPYSVRSDTITKSAVFEIKSITFNDKILLAELQKLTLDVGGRFVKGDGTSAIKYLISVDLSTKFSSITKAKEA